MFVLREKEGKRRYLRNSQLVSDINEAGIHKTMKELTVGRYAISSYVLYKYYEKIEVEVVPKRTYKSKLEMIQALTKELEEELEVAKSL